MRYESPRDFDVDGVLVPASNDRVGVAARAALLVMHELVSESGPPLASA